MPLTRSRLQVQAKRGVCGVEAQDLLLPEQPPQDRLDIELQQFVAA